MSSKIIELLNAAFAIANAQYPTLREAWVKSSFQIGGRLPGSLLSFSIQQAGEMDVLLRAMEDELAGTAPSGTVENAMSLTRAANFSGLWIGAVYEVFRLLSERKLVAESDAFQALTHDLRMLRIPLEKHEIAVDRKLPADLALQKYPPNHDETDYATYSKNDPRRSHIMPTGLSERGSVMWHVIDIAADRSYWLERREISDRIVALWDIGPR